MASFSSESDPAQVFKNFLRIDVPGQSDSTDASEPRISSSVMQAIENYFRISSYAIERHSMDSSASKTMRMEMQEQQRREQQVMLHGDDQSCIHPIYGQRMKIVASGSSWSNIDLTIVPVLELIRWWNTTGSTGITWEGSQCYPTKVQVPRFDRPWTDLEKTTNRPWADHKQTMNRPWTDHEQTRSSLSTQTNLTIVPMLELIRWWNTSWSTGLLEKGLNVTRPRSKFLASTDHEQTLSRPRTDHEQTMNRPWPWLQSISVRPSLRMPLRERQTESSGCSTVPSASVYMDRLTVMCSQRLSYGFKRRSMNRPWTDHDHGCSPSEWGLRCVCH